MEKFIDGRIDLEADLMALTQEGLRNLVDDERLEVVVKDEATAFALEKLGRSMDVKVQRKALGQDLSLSFFTPNTNYFPTLEGNGSELDLKQELVITISRTGLGPDKFGEKLMVELLAAIKGLKQLPKAIIFYNKGVELLRGEALTYKHIVGLKDMGVHICACSLSLDYYKVNQPKDKVLFSKLDMLEIMAYLAGKYKVLAF